YSIFLREPENLLIGYWEYHGSDFDQDAKKMAEDPKTKEWWKLTDPCQRPLDSHKENEWWSPLVEVFHHE
ncbi:MAG: L-rhamnose mutarotase, partial [Proteobacteria bacterium]|nr:L-rhamnose mutarotase [Pseudomonadota bacterium]